MLIGEPLVRFSATQRYKLLLFIFEKALLKGSFLKRKNENIVNFVKKSVVKLFLWSVSHGGGGGGNVYFISRGISVS
jgi:hypothetical protein